MEEIVAQVIVLRQAYKVAFLQADGGQGCVVQIEDHRPISVRAARVVKRATVEKGATDPFQQRKRNHPRTCNDKMSSMTPVRIDTMVGARFSFLDPLGTSVCIAGNTCAICRYCGSVVVRTSSDEMLLSSKCHREIQFFASCDSCTLGLCLEPGNCCQVCRRQAGGGGNGATARARSLTATSCLLKSGHRIALTHVRTWGVLRPRNAASGALGRIRCLGDTDEIADWVPRTILAR